MAVPPARPPRWSPTLSHQRFSRLAGALAALVLMLGLLPTASAHASTDQYPAPQRPTAVSVSRSAVALAWQEVPGALRYRIAYSTSSKMKAAKSVTTTSPNVELKRLKAKKTYYVTVRVVSQDGTQTLSPASATLKVKTKSKSAAYTYLAPAGLEAGSPQSDRLSLQWASRGTGLRYQVSVAANSSFAGAEHYEVKGTSTTIKDLLDGTTYYVRVRVVSSKGKARSVESPAIKVRTTPYPVTGDSTTLVVASYNVGAKSITTGGSWEARRSAVVETVL
ncbi:MAG: fibronectin type III domain-containing protein, partial [Propionibacteriaceae bacterium]|nr:fibronectin type III domain-containing protein [Propionibacteriaceae bacterium]